MTIFNTCVNTFIFILGCAQHTSLKQLWFLLRFLTFATVQLISNWKSIQIVYGLKSWTEIYLTYLVWWPFHYSYALSQNQLLGIVFRLGIHTFLITEDNIKGGLGQAQFLQASWYGYCTPVITYVYVHRISELHNQVFMQDLCQRDKVLTVQHCNRCTASGCKNIQTPHSKLFNKCWDCTIEALKSHSTFLF